MKKHGMMKTILTLILALSMCLIPACVTAEESDAVLKFPNAGIEIEILPAFIDAKGVIVPTADFEVPGVGVYIAGLSYYAFTGEKYAELAGKAQLTDEDMEFVTPRAADLLWVFCINKNRSVNELLDILTNIVGIDVDGMQGIGSAGEYRFFWKTGPDAKTAGGFEAEYRDEYEALVKACGEKPSIIRMTGPEKPASAENGSMISFETTDLAGNPVKSDELFSPYELTMINLWGTFCGPCIQEMPGLETLYQTMKAKKVNVIGVVLDISGPNDKGLIEEAEDIISTTGVKYMNLLPWDGIDAALPATAIPTTYFVDSQGQLVGRPAVGSRSAAAYEGLIDSVMAQMGK
jgi:thiol-disulfide isomerase/thioredoxin